MSLMTQPAERARNVPATNAASMPSGGTPSAAIHNAAKVGHSNNSVPTGRSMRINRANAPILRLASRPIYD